MTSGNDRRSKALAIIGMGTDAGKRLSLIDHLEELRTRIIVSLIVVAVTTGISFVFAKQLFAVLTGPAGNTQFQAIEMTELFGAYIKVSLFSGIAMAFPVLIYEVVMFIAPALTPKEKKYFFLLLPGGLLAFVLGIVFGYYILLPPAVGFLLTFGADIATVTPRIGNYVSTVTRLLFYIGISFETPIVIYFLCKMRILSPQRLSKFRKYAFVGAFVVGAVITPTFDPVNQTLVSVPLILLYELGILLARFL
ncbi:MAG: twin-arginine translocase subunit TatC [Dehalococcoidia bacterium]|nr:twin-arginine translocase subunit TatC [Dehalococcoidia bacterium]